MTNVIKDLFRWRLKQAARDRIEARQLQAIVPGFLELYARSGWCWGPGVQLTIPFDRTVMAAMPDLMKNEGWEPYGEVGVAAIIREAQAHGHNPKQMFRKQVQVGAIARDYPTAFYVEIYYGTNLEGVTCERVKVGEKIITRTEVVYEFVCKEGAAEEADRERV